MAAASQQMTYSSALLIMALSNAEPERDLALIQRHVRFLERSQIRDGGMKGGWGYSGGAVRADRGR